MAPDIFYLIFILTITVLAFLYRKKQNCLGVSYPDLQQAVAPDPCGGYSSPQTANCNRFWLYQNPMHPFFYPLIRMNESIFRTCDFTKNDLKLLTLLKKNVLSYFQGFSLKTSKELLYGTLPCIFVVNRLYTSIQNYVNNKINN